MCAVGQCAPSAALCPARPCPALPCPVSGRPVSGCPVSGCPVSGCPVSVAMLAAFHCIPMAAGERLSLHALIHPTSCFVAGIPLQYLYSVVTVLSHTFTAPSRYVYTVPLHRTPTPYLYTGPLHCTSTLYHHTVPLHCTSTVQFTVQFTAQ